jgi:ubiquinone/menaquinone biosynthesis C-methylase UbiE
MTENRFPHEREMADESMVRTLRAQAEALWPQEAPLFARYALPATAQILDAGCGTGEMTLRLAQMFPAAKLLGVDILAGHLELARRRADQLGLADRVRFEERSVYQLGLADASFDLVLCRHVLHSIPHIDQVLAELKRVLRPAGTLHVLAEDYGLIAFEPRAMDASDFWNNAPPQFGKATDTDLLSGRKMYRLFHQQGLRNVTVDYLVVDTVRVPRQTFAAIWQAWSDGYADAIGLHTNITRDQCIAHFQDMLATIRDPDGYGVWFAPVLAGQRADQD